MHISVFGAGYVGLVTSACLADVGHDVVCVDTDASKVEALERGTIPIYEPGLEPLVARNIAAKRLRFTTDGVAAARHGTVLFIAVGTPPGADGSADLGQVLSVAAMIGEAIEAMPAGTPKIVVDKSTVPVGTADAVQKAIDDALQSRFPTQRERPPVAVCSNPEFLKEGAAIDDFTRGARIVVGTDSERVREAMRELYAPYNRNRDKLMFMDVRSAELTKYAANGMLATKISFMNEIANLAERLGADVEAVRRGIGSDPRIGYDFIYAGCGYGGSCFPKDVRALIRTGAAEGYDLKLLAAVEMVNEAQQRTLFSKLSDGLGGALAGRTIAVWGLAFKPGTDDMRDAPSRVLIEAVLKAGGRVQAFDPVAMDVARGLFRDKAVSFHTTSPMEALEGADALVICTEWKEFRVVDFRSVAAMLGSKLIVDGRNLYDPEQVAAAGLRYRGVGRMPAVPIDPVIERSDAA